MYQPETQYRPPIPQTRRDLVGCAALSLTAWILTALFYVFVVLPYHCTGELCGLGLVGPTFLFVGVSIVFSATAVIWALSVALRAGERVAAAAFGALLAAAALAAYALLQNGHPDHPVLTALYGFPPDGLSLHPIAYYGSAALVVALPLLVLPYALIRGRAHRVSAFAGPLFVLVGWIAIHLAG